MSRVLDPIKVVFLTFGGNLYGANQSMVGLAGHLRNLHFDPLIVYPEHGAIVDRLEKNGLSGHFSPYKLSVHWNSPFPRFHPRLWISETANLVRSIRKFLLNRRILPGLVSTIRSTNAALIVSNTSTIAVGHHLARKLGLPHVWYIREFGDLDWGFYPDFGPRSRERLLRQSAHLIFISQTIAHHHLKGMVRPLPAYSVVENGVVSADTLRKRYDARPQGYTLGKDTYTFSIVGLIADSKGQSEAIEALSILRERAPKHRVRLNVAGGGNDAGLRSLIERYQLSDVVSLLGHQTDLEPVYRESDCGLMCSRAEAFGRVTAEFMSWGRPVIGKNSGATPELIQHGLNGLLYDHGAFGLADAMEHVIKNPLATKAMGDNARNVAKERFTYDQCAKRVSGIFRDVLQIEPT